MNKKEAYTIVYKDLMRGSPMLRGIYDARHANEHFMAGIFTVMEILATSAGKEFEDEYAEIWEDNVRDSFRKKLMAK